MFRFLAILTVMVGVLCIAGPVRAEEDKAPMSDLTRECIECHTMSHPGIVADWKRSRHARITPARALKKDELTRRVSAKKIPDKLADFSVGCAECHMLNPAAHPDTFEHAGQKVHVTVTPKDCSTCHPDEHEQFKKNTMSWAHVNLAENPVYQSLMKEINGMQTLKNMHTETSEPDPLTNQDSCYHCHGTKVTVKGTKTVETDLGEMTFPILDGWPNQGVGRINPDGSKGACSACHSRHQFSIVMARKPYTCSQCHKGPDVPAYKAYNVSKHGNLTSAMYQQWNYDNVPWTVGKDIGAPTCATCHVSLLVDEFNTTIAERTHQMTDRLPWRILGLIYAHPHPEDPNTSIIRNKNGLPLPTTLDNIPASEFLIDEQEMAKRQEKLQRVCRSCHSTRWVDGHWERFENTIEKSNELTLTSTKILLKAWEKKAASQKPSLFDEPIERQWVEEWLFFSNSTRFASAMMGADYGVFANGRWYATKNIEDMLDRLKFLLNARKNESGKKTE